MTIKKINVNKDKELYGVEYLKRWGNTDFLKNWKQLANNILRHAPSNLKRSELKVLDIGCLNGYFLEALRRSGVKHIYGIDLSKTIAIDNVVNKDLIPYITVGDFGNNKYPSNYFDLIVCSEVLEHVEPNKTQKFVNEMVRVLNSKGVILVTTSEDLTADPTHINCRGRLDWYQIFLKAGLTPKIDQVLFPGFNNFGFVKNFKLVNKLFYIVLISYLSIKKMFLELKKKFRLQVGLSNEKFRLTWTEKTLKNLPAGLKILDAGAGELQFKKFCSHLSYVSQDFGKYDGSGDSKGIQTKSWDNSMLDIVSDIVSIPVKDSSFDVVLCTEVFEHIPNPVLAINEFSRILKTGGKLIITAPFCSLTHFSPYYFSNGFSKYYYEKHLTDAGFKIVELTPNGNYFEYLGQELRRLNSVSAQYSNSFLSVFDKGLIYFVLRIIERLSKKDKGSSDLLNFGYQVLAIKK